MKKKFYSIFMIITFILQSTIFAEVSDVEVTDTTEKKYSESITFLIQLGIVDEPKSGDFREDYGITRGDFSIALAKAVGFEKEYKADETYFDDVTQKTACYGAVDFLIKKGAISKGSANFRPNDPILYNDAVKMTVCAIGYGAIAQYAGGYPNGYLKAAQDNGLLKGTSVSEDGTITRGNACTLIFNMLKSNSLTSKLDSQGKAEFNVSEDEKIFEALFDLKEYEGLVTATEHGNIYGSEIISSDNIVIDYERYRCTINNIADYLGHKVKYYVREDENGFDTVVALFDRTDNVINISSEQISAETTKSKFFYYNASSSVKTAKISKDAFYCYNGRPVYEVKDEYLKPSCGSVVLIENDGDSEYDVIIIKNYELHSVEFASETNEVISFKDGTNIDYDESIHHIYKNGAKCGISDILPNNILSVAASIDKTYVECILSDKSISGMITSVYTKDECKYIKMDSNDYPAVERLDVTAGISGTSYISHNGYVVDFKKTEDYLYGYLTKVFIDDSDDMNLNLKVFTSDGVMTKFVCSDNISVISYDESGQQTTNRFKDNSEDAFEKIKACASPSGDFIQQLIRYKINSDNEINNIEFAKSSDASTWDESVFSKNIDSQELVEKKIIANENGGFRTGYLTILSKEEKYACLTDSNTKVFYLTSDEDDWKAYSVNQYGRDNNFPSAKAYDIGEDGIAKAVVITSSSKISDSFSPSDPLLCISGISKGVNDNDEIVTYLTGFGNKKSDYSCFTNDEDLTSNAIQSSCKNKKFSELRKGDVIQVKVDTEGKILSFRVLYEYELDSEFAYSPEGSTTTSWSGERSGFICYGNLFNVTDSTYVMYNDTFPKKKAILFEKTTYALFDKDSKTVTPITRKDLYKGAEVFVFTIPIHGVDFVIVYK